MIDAVFAHRIQFAFTIMFHYLFPILTMGLGVFIAILATLYLFTEEERYDRAARFWTRIFAINFAIGVVTGIPMEFEFGTNWSRFAQFGGGVFGQTLPLEGVYAFFLESGFLGLYHFGRGRVTPVIHWLSAIGVSAGSLLSGYFIVATDAFMQHPVGYLRDAQGIHLQSFWAVLFNPYVGWQYAHTINGALVAGAFVMAAVGAFYLLLGQHLEFARLAVKMGVIAGLVLSLTQLFPTGDRSSKDVVAYQPVKLAAMEGLFHSQKGAPLAIIGMPDSQTETLMDPVYVPRFLSYLAYGQSEAQVAGLSEYSRTLWPPVELTYYAYHIMAGLGTVFIVIMAVGVVLLWRRRLYDSRWFLWILMLSFPFPLIANEAGWVTAEVGRQPWLIYGLLRTAQGTSPTVTAGETIFTLLGFAGIYALLAMLYLFLVVRAVLRGPEGQPAAEPAFGTH
jgi:cytochrome d ubiquinol oxidase subunit I